jgi:hypothetical protein
VSDAHDHPMAASNAASARPDVRSVVVSQSVWDGGASTWDGGASLWDAITADRQYAVTVNAG